MVYSHRKNEIHDTMWMNHKKTREVKEVDKK